MKFLEKFRPHPPHILTLPHPIPGPHISLKKIPESKILWQKQEHEENLGITSVIITIHFVKGKGVQPANHLKLPIILLQSTSPILNTHYHEPGIYPSNFDIR